MNGSWRHRNLSFFLSYHLSVNTFRCTNSHQPLLSSHKLLFNFLGAIARFRKTISFVMSVCPHATTRLALDGLWLNLIFDLFSKFCRENSSCIKSDKNNGYFTWNFSRLWQYLAKFFLDWEKFQRKFLEKIKCTFYVHYFFPKYVVEPEEPQMTSQYGAHALNAG